MNCRPPDPELRRLVDSLHDGPPLSKPEVARLEELLEDDDALFYYLDVTQQEALAPTGLDRLPATADAGPARRISRIPWVPVSLAAAACLIFALGLNIGRREVAPAVVAVPDTARPDARITGLVGVEWNDGEAPDLLGQDAAAGHLLFKTGLVELTYGSGVKLTLEGPVDYLVNDAVSGRLDVGKLYATIPPGAEGFRVDYSLGSVVDLGTEFAMEARPDGTTELGVFDGEIELHRPGLDPLSLFENQAVVHGTDTEEPFHAVPLDRDKFVRDLPSRDFPWKTLSSEPREIVIDVTHLVWKPSEYRAVFKWIHGRNAMIVRDVRLCLDGETVARDVHRGQTGAFPDVSDNVYALDLNSADFRRGQWTVVARIEAGEPTSELAQKPTGVPGSIKSRGILQFEEGLVTSAGPEDFIGRWSYNHVGYHYVREFHPDGRVTLTKNGKAQPMAFVDSRWWVEDGVLQVSEPKDNMVQSHVLRDLQTLVFVSQPYENARKFSRE